MKRFISSLIILTGISITALPAQAEVHAKPTEKDSRIRQFTYEQNEVYVVNGAPGFVQSIIFAEGEVITTIEIGDSETWSTVMHNSGDRLAIKPNYQTDKKTNLSITTDRHTYTFVLNVLPNEQVQAFRYQFEYPEPDAIELIQSNIAAYYDAETNGRLITSDYSAAGDPILTPVATWDDGEKTYIKLSNLATRAAIFEVVDNNERLVNTRDLPDGTIVIDGVFPQLSIRDGKHYTCVFNVPLYSIIQEARN